MNMEESKAGVVSAPKQLNVEGNIYEVMDLLGKGGYATAHSAKLINGHVNSPKMVAIKMINTQRFKCSERLTDYVLKEVCIMRRLKHGNILKLHGHLVVGNVFYLVLELCPNKTLNHIMKSSRIVLSMDEMRDLFHQMARGCDYLHSLLIVHRDIKPDNILLDANFTLKIGDFGLAAQLSSASELLYTYCGTPKYQAPESILGQGYGLGVDVWAMGCTVYRLFYGKAAFQHTNIAELQQAIVNGNVKYSRCTHNEQALKAQDITMLKSLLCKHQAKRATAAQVIGNEKYFALVAQASLRMSFLVQDEGAKLLGMITNLERISKACKVNKRLRVDYLGEDCLALKPAHWIVHWASDVAFGYAYMTNTNILGASFNDGTRMLLIDAMIVFWCKTNAVQHFELQDCPQRLITKLTILVKLKEKSVNKLKNKPASVAQIESWSKLPWLMGHVETERAFVFHLSSAQFQISFPEKILLFDGSLNSMTTMNTAKQVSLTLDLAYIQQQESITQILANYISVSLSYIRLLQTKLV